MEYIIFDLEFNQEYNHAKKDKKNIASSCPFEIIQIGALKLDENLNTISTFNSFIRPEIYIEIHPFVREITGITNEQLNSANSFIVVYEEFIKFIGSNKSILCVWGANDIKELFRNIKYHQLDTSKVPKEYINLQAYISKYFNCPRGIHIGLQNATELLNIPITSQFHDGFNDAFYTAELFKLTYANNFPISVYNPDDYRKRNRAAKANQTVDLLSLIKQFEKMFYREMSSEEQKIIKLAYFMGKTNQFQVNK
jgi:inhibitor of KinA sporulation pathway (predicted exonuclease)